MNIKQRANIIEGLFFVLSSWFFVGERGIAGTETNAGCPIPIRERRTKNQERRTGVLQAAFTLVELLVVVSIIAILLGIVVPTYYSVREKAKYTKAKVTAKNLETALKAYLDHYRVWPAAWKENTDVEIKDDVFKILRGDPGMPDNSAAIAFYEFSDSTNAADGALDTWSDPNDKINTIWQTYRFRVDENYDNKIGDDLYRTVIVWSPGPDRTNNTSDDVKSWE